jgi:sulfatase modifying factor 1
MLLRSPLAICLVLFGLARTAYAVTIDWTPIGDPGNPADTRVMIDNTTGYGSVPYAYNIGTYEVTNAQYAEFLNAKAAVDMLELYNPNMGSSNAYGGITRTGSVGSYSYSAIAGREDMPVNFVTFYDALRFANWLNNGQGIGDTETGAYTLLGGTPAPINGTSVTRNVGATVFLPSEDEWYKAAYYDAITTSYFAYPAGSDSQTTCSTPTATTNSANCSNAARDLTIKGSYPGSASPYGTFDQGGNVEEWNEAIIGGLDGCTDRGIRGASLGAQRIQLAARSRTAGTPGRGYAADGFRVASIPEPGTGLLVMVGLLGLARPRRSAT